ADDVDPDQCPDQDVDAAHRVEAAPREQADQTVGDDVAGREKAEWATYGRAQQRAEESNGKSLSERIEIEQSPRPGLWIGWQHQFHDVKQPAEAGDDLGWGNLENHQPCQVYARGRGA